MQLPIFQVVERHSVLYKALTYYPFQKRYKNYLLTDMQGTKIKAVMFDRDIDFFERSLQPFKRYNISNANVTLPPEQFQLQEYRFSWTIHSKTPVEPILDAQPYVLPCRFDVCKFRDLHRFAETDANIAVRALVVHSFPVVDITPTKSAKDYVVVNKEEIPMVLRLWKNLLSDYDPSIDSFRKTPVTIIASNLEVRTFHGLSLATRNNTYLIENPPLAEDLGLKQWYAENNNRVDEWLKNKAYENNNSFFPHPKEDEVLDLQGAMEAFRNVKTCWIKGKCRLSVTQNPLYEVLCASCQMIVDADMDWNVQCSGCAVLSPMKVRFNLPVTLNDESTSIRSTIKTPDAEKLSPFTALEIKRLEAEGQSPLHDLTISIDNTEVICFVKYYDKMIAGETVRRYVILKAYTLDEMKALAPAASSTIQSTTNLDTTDDATLFTAIPPLSPQSNKAAESESQFLRLQPKKSLKKLPQNVHQESLAIHNLPVLRGQLALEQ